jgi:hypothetical protein
MTAARVRPAELHGLAGKGINTKIALVIGSAMTQDLGGTLDVKCR